CEPSDPVAEKFRKPDIAVRPGGDAEGFAADGRDGELRDHPGGVDPPDPVARGFREPDIAVRSGRDADRAGGQGMEHRDLASDVDPADNVVLKPGEPDSIEASSGGNVPGLAVRHRESKLRDHSIGRDPADLVAPEFRKPDIAVRPACNTERPAAGCRDWK